MNTLFFDVDTQNDFLLPSGALYVPGAEAIIPALSRLNRYARENGHALISTVDAHAENDPEFTAWPAHCVAGTFGQRKPEGTMVGQRIVEKQVLDSFSLPEVPALLAEIHPQRIILYGVVTEICVRYAATGLLRTGARVEWVTDACRALSEDAAKETWEAFAASGGVLTTLDRVLI